MATPKKKPTMMRQGDVLLVRVEEEIATTEDIAREGGRVVLAHGEVTGHAHALAEPHVEHRRLAKPLEHADEGAVVSLLTVIGQDAWLRHEEHAPIQVPPGRYLVVRQREYVPRELPRTVAD